MGRGKGSSKTDTDEESCGYESLDGDFECESDNESMNTNEYVEDYGDEDYGNEDYDNEHDNTEIITRFTYHAENIRAMGYNCGCFTPLMENCPSSVALSFWVALPTEWLLSSPYRLEQNRLNDKYIIIMFEFSDSYIMEMPKKNVLWNPLNKRVIAKYCSNSHSFIDSYSEFKRLFDRNDKYNYVEDVFQKYFLKTLPAFIDKLRRNNKTSWTTTIMQELREYYNNTDAVYDEEVEENTPLFYFFMENAEIEHQKNNPLLCAVRMMRELLLSNQYCAICFSKLKFNSYRLCACENPLCQFRFSNDIPSSFVVDMIRQDPHSCQLLFMIAKCACYSQSTSVNDLTVPEGGYANTSHVKDRNTRMVFHPHPSFSVSGIWKKGNGVLRGTKNTYTIHCSDDMQAIHKNNIIGAQLEIAVSYNDEPDMEQVYILQSFEGNTIMTKTPIYMDITQCEYYYRESYDFNEFGISKQYFMLLHDMYTNLPSIQDILLHLDSYQFNTLENMPVFERNSSLLFLMRWTLLSNPVQLRYINYEKNKHWFICLSGTPEREKEFYRLKKETPDSILRFHGSNIANWWSILCKGPNYTVVANARAYGHGIYHACDFGTSDTYSGSGYGSNKHQLSIVSLHEIINDNRYFISTNPYVVVSNVDAVIPRFLIVQDISKTMENMVKSPLLYNVVKWKNTKGISMEVPNIDMDCFQPLEASALYQEHLHSVCQPIVFEEYDIYKQLFQVKIREMNRIKKTVETKIDNMDIDMSKVVEEKFTRKEITYPTRTIRFIQSRLKEMYMLQESSKGKTETLQFEMVGEPDILRWEILIKKENFAKDSTLLQDLNKKNIDGITIIMYFPPTFPESPPYVRIKHPRFKTQMEGGGGHVMDGGAICIDIFTGEGWRSTYTIEALLMVILTTIGEGGKLDERNWNRKYTLEEGQTAFKRFLGFHTDWKITDDFYLYLKE